jgi:hypothetical protein
MMRSASRELKSRSLSKILNKNSLKDNSRGTNNNEMVVIQEGAEAVILKEEIIKEAR